MRSIGEGPKFAFFFLADPSQGLNSDREPCSQGLSSSHSQERERWGKRKIDPRNEVDQTVRSGIQRAYYEATGQSVEATHSTLISNIKFFICLFTHSDIPLFDLRLFLPTVFTLKFSPVLLGRKLAGKHFYYASA